MMAEHFRPQNIPAVCAREVVCKVGIYIVLDRLSLLLAHTATTHFHKACFVCNLASRVFLCPYRDMVSAQAGPGLGRAAGRGMPVAAPGQAPAVSFF